MKTNTLQQEQYAIVDSVGAKYNIYGKSKAKPLHIKKQTNGQSGLSVIAQRNTEDR
jgi:hypothetical protein